MSNNTTRTFKNASTHFSNSKCKRLNDDLAMITSPDESIFICQLDYWIQRCKDNQHKKDGRYWIWKTYDGWCKEFPYWSKRKIQRMVRSLQKHRILILGNYNRMPGDRTTWYTIDYDLMDNLLFEYRTNKNHVDKMTTGYVAEHPLECGQSDHAQGDKVTTAIPYNTTDITTNNTNGNNKWSNSCSSFSSSHEESHPVFDYYMNKYMEYFGVPHPELSYFVKDKVIRKLDEYSTHADHEIMCCAIDIHFDTDYSQEIDYNICHFATDGILTNRLHECGVGYIEQAF